MGSNSMRILLRRHTIAAIILRQDGAIRAFAKSGYDHHFQLFGNFRIGLSRLNFTVRPLRPDRIDDLFRPSENGLRTRKHLLVLRAIGYKGFLTDDFNPVDMII
jgi:hypothetical protein